jgi:uncharacterized protein YcfL
MLKKFLAISLSLFIFTACSSEGEVAGADIPAGMVGFQNNNFLIVAPQQWEVLEKKDFTSNIPLEAVVIFQSPLKHQDFTAVVNITETPLASNINANDFGRGSLQQVKNRLLNFQEINVVNTSVTKGVNEVDGLLAEFQGRRSANEQRVQFKQLYVTDNGMGYTITGAFKLNEDETIVTQVDEMLDSFRLN